MIILHYSWEYEFVLLKVKAYFNWSCCPLNLEFSDDYRLLKFYEMHFWVFFFVLMKRKSHLNYEVFDQPPLINVEVFKLIVFSFQIYCKRITFGVYSFQRLWRLNPKQPNQEHSLTCIYKVLNIKQIQINHQIKSTLNSTTSKINRQISYTLNIIITSISLDQRCCIYFQKHQISVY